MLFREHPLAALRRSWPLIAGCTVTGLILALLLSLLQPLEYSSTVRLLITQPGATNIDPYTVLKSNERIADNLSLILYGSNILENILLEAQDVNKDYFPTDEYARRQLWAKTISTSVEPGSGLMLVTAFHPDRDQARAIVLAASQELIKQAPNFFGYSVRVQVINTPLDSQWFARPNFLDNGLIGLAIGLLLGLLWVLFRKERA